MTLHRERTTPTERRLKISGLSKVLLIGREIFTNVALDPNFTFSSG